MNISKRAGHLGCALLVALVCMMIVVPSHAQEGDVPAIISYQGQFLVNGQPANGTERFSFAILTPDGSEAWQQEYDVQVSDGIFSVLLGREGGGSSLAQAFQEHDELFLSISTGGEEIDRIRFASSPYALRAGVADALADGVAVRDVNGVRGSVTLAAGGLVSLAQEDDTITFSVSEDVAGLSEVNTDGTISGDGTSDSPLTLADEAVTTDKIADGAVTRDKLTQDAVGLSEVSTDGTIEGDGTSDSPLSLADEAVTTDKVADGAITLDKLDGNAAVTSLEVNEARLRGNIPIRGSGGVDIRHEDDEIIIHGRTFPSALRYKDDVQPIAEALALVQQLEGVQFSWREDGRVDLGFIAEEVAPVLPEVVVHNESGEVEGLNYHSLIALLVEAIKEQQETITEVETRLDRLESLIREQQ